MAIKVLPGNVARTSVPLLRDIGRKMLRDDVTVPLLRDMKFGNFKDGNVFILHVDMKMPVFPWAATKKERRITAICIQTILNGAHFVTLPHEYTGFNDTSTGDRRWRLRRLEVGQDPKAGKVSSGPD